MSNKSASTNRSGRSDASSESACVVPVGGISGPPPVGAGGISGPPPSALTAGANTDSTQHSSSVAVSLFTAFPPFFGADQRESIQPGALDIQSYFARFWALRCAGEFVKALAACDLILELADPTDYDSHMRESSARAMALRGLGEYRTAYRAHMQAKCLRTLASPVYVGDHYHGLGVTLTELGEHVRAFACLQGARRLHEGEPARVAHIDVNTARLLARMGHGAEAREILDAVTDEALQADAAIARALAYEAEGDKPNARRAIGSALVLLADSENEATRTEALSVLNRIEAASRGLLADVSETKAEAFGVLARGGVE